MKAIYDAARDILYPKHKQHAAGVAFGHGLNSYRPAVRQALVAFEHANRGHRDMLEHESMSLAHAGRPAGPYSDQSYRSMRARVRDTTFGLAMAIIEGQPHPPSRALRKLMACQDTQGWLPHFAQGRIYEMCLLTKRLGLHRNFYALAHVDTKDTGIYVHLTVCSALGHFEAKRTVGPFTDDTRTFQGIVELLPKVRTALKKLVADAPSWPEFAKLSELGYEHIE